MNKKADIIFNSKNNQQASFQLASGYISQTTVFFEEENILAIIQAKGEVSFFKEDALLATGSVIKVESGKGVYEEINLKVKNNVIELNFPVYQWIDHYPNCDGEHDRWSTKIIGYNTLNFDLNTNTII